MKTKSFSHEATFKKETSIEVIQVSDDLFAFRTISMWSHSGKNDMPCPPDTDMQGFANAEEIVKAIRGEPFSQVGRAMIFSPELETIWRQHGVNRPHRQKQEFDAAWQSATENVFEKLKGDLFGPEHVVLMNWSNHEIQRLDGSFVAKAILFSSSNGGFSSLRFDLQKAYEHLSSRDDVQVCRSIYGRHDFETTATNVKEAISDVPRYDDSDPHKREIVFKWMPSDLDYNRMQNGIDPRQFGSWKAAQSIFDQDLLGLRAAGACLFETFNEEIEPEVDPDDDFRM